MHGASAVRGCVPTPPGLARLSGSIGRSPDHGFGLSEQNQAVLLDLIAERDRNQTFWSFSPKNRRRVVSIFGAMSSWRLPPPLSRSNGSRVHLE